MYIMGVKTLEQPCFMRLVVKIVIWIPAIEYELRAYVGGLVV